MALSDGRFQTGRDHLRAPSTPTDGQLTDNGHVAVAVAVYVADDDNVGDHVNDHVYVDDFVDGGSAG